MKTIRKLLLLCLFGMISMGVPVYAFDFSATWNGKVIYYSITSRTAPYTVEVARQGSYEYEGDISIPSTVTYDGKTYAVERIGEDAFYYCKKISSISIPSSVTSIGEHAFSGCSGLKSVTLPNSVKSIGATAFQDCEKLTNIEIPAVYFIGADAFSNCANLKNVSIERETPLDISKADEISYYGPFRGSTNLSNITLHVPYGTKSLYESADVWKDFGTIVEMGPDYDAMIALEIADVEKLAESLTFKGDKKYVADQFANIVLPLSSVSEYEEALTYINAAKEYIRTATNYLKLYDAVKDYTALQNCYDVNSDQYAILQKPLDYVKGLGSTESDTYKDALEAAEVYKVYDSYIKAFNKSAYYPPQEVASVTAEQVAYLKVNYASLTKLNEFKSTLYKAITDAIKENCNIPDGEYYIQNVESGAWLGSGNAWGAQATLLKHPTPFGLTLCEEGYSIDTYTYNSATGHYLSIIDGSQWMDQAIEYWDIIKQNDGTFTISLDGKYLSSNDGTVGDVVTTTTDKSSLNARWRILSQDDMLKTFDNASIVNSVDATFLIQVPNFSRNQCYKAQGMSPWTKIANYVNLRGGNNTNNCAESWRSSFDVYQTVTVPNGVYELSVQAAWQNYAETYIDENSPVVYANDKTSKFNIMDDSDHTNSMAWFSKQFTAGKYYITPIRVEVTNGELTVGVRGTNTTDDWCLWDNFELSYFGKGSGDSREDALDNLNMGAITARAGSHVTLPIYMNNDLDVCNFQFDIQLPEGFSIVQNGTRVKTNDISLGSARFEGLDHTVSSSIQSDGSVRVLVSSTQNTSIWNENEKGDDIRKSEPVINIILDIASEITDGDYPVILKNITLTNYSNGQTSIIYPSNEQAAIKIINTYSLYAECNALQGSIKIEGVNYDSESHQAHANSDVSVSAIASPGYVFWKWQSNGQDVSRDNPYTFTITSDYSLSAQFVMLGDVLEDQHVNVGDLTEIAGYILRSEQPADGTMLAADVYTDGIINVGDFTSIAGIILNGYTEGTSASNSISLRDVCNLQFDMQLPIGVELSTEQIVQSLRSTNLGLDHSISANILSNGKIRVLVTSLRNASIADAVSSMKQLSIESGQYNGCYDITLSNIVMGYNDMSVESIDIMYSVLVIGSATDISDVTDSSNLPQDVYSITGQKLAGKPKGINIINGKKVLVK